MQRLRHGEREVFMSPTRKRTQGPRPGGEVPSGIRPSCAHTSMTTVSLRFLGSLARCGFSVRVCQTSTWKTGKNRAVIWRSEGTGGRRRKRRLCVRGGCWTPSDQMTDPSTRRCRDERPGKKHCYQVLHICIPGVKGTALKWKDRIYLAGSGLSVEY